MKPEVQARWRAEIDQRSTGHRVDDRRLHHWYTNAEGRNTNNWVGPWLEYRRRTRRINPGDYRAAV